MAEPATRYTVKQIDWSSSEADIAKAIRFNVFVDEQKVPAEMELDEIDAEAVHVVAFDADNVACGTGRMFISSENRNFCKIGRMAVLETARGTGCGAAILNYLIDHARGKGFTGAELSAQVHAVPFYQKFGFVADPDVYDDAGIPHQHMRLVFVPSQM